MSDIAECTEVVEDKAVNFSRGNVEDLKNKLELITKDSCLVGKLKKDTTRFICSKYNWDVVTEQTLRMYIR